MSSRFDAAARIASVLKGELEDGDVLVISSKYLAISEGRVVDIGAVVPGEEAKRLAAAYGVDPRLCELVVRESDEVVGGIPGFLMASVRGLLTPNAGIDRSNVAPGKAVLYPRRPEAAARRVRDAVKFATGADVGVVVCDSRLFPTRKGTTGVALAASGLEAILDLRGKKDLFGNVLKVTAEAVADDLCSAAELIMGESDEATPVVVVRGLRRDLVKDVEYPPERFAIDVDDDLYLRSVGFRRGRNRLLGSRRRRGSDDL